MTLKTLSLLIIWMSFSSAVFASNSEKQSVTSNLNAGITEESIPSSDNTGTAHQLPFIPAAESKVPQHKSSTPEMEELPHIHKYHKERVKKIKKHHSKLWVISQVLIVICQLSMLLIAFLHVIH